MENSQKEAELSKWNSRRTTKEIPLLSCFFFCCSTQSLTAAQWPTRALRRNKWMESGSDAKEQYGSSWAAGGEAQRQKLSWMENLFAFHLKLIPCDFSCCGRFLAFLWARVLIRSFVSLVGSVVVGKTLKFSDYGIAICVPGGGSERQAQEEICGRQLILFEELSVFNFWVSFKTAKEVLLSSTGAFYGEKSACHFADK